MGKIKKNRCQKPLSKTIVEASIKNRCQERKSMMTNKNRVVLFVKELENRVEQAVFFVEHPQCGYMMIVVLVKSFFL